MADIQKLTEEILREAKEKAQEILKAAETAAQEELSQAKADSAAQKEQILRRAQTEADLLKERILSGAQLKMRDEKLKAKGQVIDRVMDSLKQKIENLPPEKELAFIEEELKDRQLTAEETLCVRQGLGQAVCDRLGLSNVKEEPGLAGYTIEKGGISENHSFQTTMDYLKEDLEAAASDILFRK